MAKYVISVEVKSVTIGDDGAVTEDSVYSWRDRSSDEKVAIAKQLLVGRAVCNGVLDAVDEMAAQAGVKLPRVK